MRIFISVGLLLLSSCNNSGDAISNERDSLDSVAHAEKQIIDSAADRSREQVDSIEKAGKKMVDSTITQEKQQLEKQDSIRKKR
jgi:hypothetical protein